MMDQVTWMIGRMFVILAAVVGALVGGYALAAVAHSLIF